MKNILKYPAIIVFAAFILILAVLDLLKEDTRFSEMENRVLQQRPKFTYASLMERNEDQKYTGKYEKYINDQFIFRNGWISIKSIGEGMLGKQENNGIVYGKDGFLFERFDQVDQDRMNKNVGFVNQFAAKYDLPVTFAIIPNSYMLLPDKLPYGLKTIDQEKYIQAVFKAMSGENLSKEYIGPFGHEQEYVYYKTDHHWTTLGAYYAYCQLMESKGKAPVPLKSLEPFAKTVEPFYGTYYSKAKKVNSVTDIITYYDIPAGEVTINNEVKNSLYDYPQFEKRDAYAGFLYGNNGLTVIKSANNLEHKEGETSRLLIIKDSYANCFIPFLTYNYDEIYVVDLRGLTSKMSQLMTENEFTEVLVMYNFKNFVTDTNLARLVF